MPNTCESCKYRLVNDCKRYPPTVFMVMQPPRIQGQDAAIAFASQSALVNTTNWCGEYVERL